MNEIRCYNMIGFFLRSQKTQGRATIYTRLKRSRPYIFFPYISTGIEVDIETWNRVNKTAKTWNNYIEGPGKEIYRKLNMITKAINQLISGNKIKGNEDKALIDETIANIVNGEIHIEQSATDDDIKEENHITVVSYYEQFYQGICDGSIRHGNNEMYSDGTVIIWKQFGQLLKDYSSPEMTFGEITKSYADNFSVFLESKKYMPKTVNKYIICFRKLCNLAAEEGVNANAVSLKVWKEKKVKETEKRTELYLTNEEIDALYAMKLDGIEDQVRDVFLLGVFSGQRVSDYSRLGRDNFTKTVNSTPVISLYQQKTGTYVEIPYVDSRVDELCQKYDYLFPVLDSRDVNRYIKYILARLAETVETLKEWHPTVLSQSELNKEINYSKMDVQYQSGQVMEPEKRKYYLKLKKYAEEHNGSPLYYRDKQGRVMMRKYELVSSHTARRSAITNLYKSGVLDSREIMSISGHKTEAVFEHYIRVGVSEQADRVYMKMLKLKNESQN